LQICLYFDTTEYEGATDLFFDGGGGFNNPTVEADELIKETPFLYRLEQELIVVSLGTGGSLYKTYFDSFWERAASITRAVTECRKTARRIHKLYNDNEHGNVKYYRFDPDAVGRHAMDDASKFNDIQNEILNWCNSTVHEQLKSLAESLYGALTETMQVLNITITNITTNNACNAMLSNYQLVNQRHIRSMIASQLVLQRIRGCQAINSHSNMSLTHNIMPRFSVYAAICRNVACVKLYNTLTLVWCSQTYHV
jgi:hypothetical protein